MQNHPLFQKYSRQMLFDRIGSSGQEKINNARVLVVGCGALGSGILELLVRAGFGRIRFVDRDFVEMSNLQRQTLFTEADVANRIPKAIAAVRALAQINSHPKLEPLVADFSFANAEKISTDVDVIFDGTDNFETRFLINEVSIKLGVPWMYGGCVASNGVFMPVLPGRTPCLRCLMPEPFDRSMFPTCDTIGILASVARIVSSIEVATAMKLVVEGALAIEPVMIQIDCWDNDFLQVDVTNSRLPDCPVCARHEFSLLSGVGAAQVVSFCGRDMMQISIPSDQTLKGKSVDLSALAIRLEPIGQVKVNEYMLTLTIPPLEMTLFKDGRCMIKGTTDPAEAKSLYARYFGL